jgi:molybdopterin-binding protein
MGGGREVSTAIALAAENIRRSFPRSGFTLDVPEIEIPAGTVLALLGPSGSGKSTLLQVLGLLERPDAGRVLLGGREVGVRDRAARLSMAAVFQRPYLFKGGVAENVGYGLAVRGVPAHDRAERVAAALESVGLPGFQDRSALSLSGGEAQRVSLARALVLEPRVLLLDEPLASLDALLRRRLALEFSAILRESGTTAVWVTHDHDEALVVAQQIAIMSEGRIIASGPAEEVMHLPTSTSVAEVLGVAPPLCGTVAASGDGLVEIDSGSVIVAVTGEAPVGAGVRFAVQPEDVILFGADAALPKTTARNQLLARVEACEPRGATNLVALAVGGVRFSASVSRAATADLGLAPGCDVLAIFKATAVRWRLETAGEFGARAEEADGESGTRAKKAAGNADSGLRR